MVEISLSGPGEGSRKETTWGYSTILSSLERLALPITSNQPTSYRYPPLSVSWERVSSCRLSSQQPAVTETAGGR